MVPNRQARQPLHPAPTEPVGIRSSVLWLAGVLLCALFLWSVALFSVDVLYQPMDVLALWLLYFLLALLLCSLARWALSRGLAIGWCSLVFLAGVLGWQVREQTRRPDSLLLLLLGVVLLGTTLLVLSRRRTSISRRRLTPVIGVGAVFASLFIALFFFRPTLRWHLLRHNTLLGTPAYYLLARSVPEIRGKLFAKAAAAPGSFTVSADEPTTREVEAVRPNVVFVLVDTLRADALAPWGGDASLMPNLHRWLEGADRFTDVVANSSWTRPSIASMLTGLLPEEHGARDVDNPLVEGYQTFPEKLSALGYETVALVTNIGAAGAGAGFAQGFDLFHQFDDEPYARADKVNRTLEAWMDRRETTDRPLLLYLHYLDPHEPYLSGDAPRSPVAADYEVAYRRELEFFDQAFEELLVLLGSGLDGPTKLIFVSDHGEELFEHGLFGHGHSLYDEVVKIPLALGDLTAAPVGHGGSDLDARLEGRDVHDLVVQLAGDPRVSVADWAASRARERRYLSLHYTGSGRLLLRPYRRHNLMRALDEADRKMIWSGYGETYELYDLVTDPGEHHNLSAQEPTRVERMAADLDRQIQEWVKAPVAEIDQEALRQLRSLGYVEF